MVRSLPGVELEVRRRACAVLAVPLYYTPPDSGVSGNTDIEFWGSFLGARARYLAAMERASR